MDRVLNDGGELSVMGIWVWWVCDRMYGIKGFKLMIGWLGVILGW